MLRKFTLLTRCLRTALLLAVFGAAAAHAADAVQAEWDGVERLVVIGDVHGDYDNYVAVLEEAGLINRRGNWAGGETHFVQVGDVPDRGPDTDKIIEHLQRLERQAERAGGMVHALIGNHEFMNVTGDLRYVHPGEYEALTSRNSGRLRDAYYQQIVQATEARNETLEEPVIIDDAFRDKWYAEFPLGYVEHRLTWQPGGDFNTWVSTHNSVIRINDMLFMHAGLGPDMLDKSITAINDTIRAEILGAYDYNNSLGDSQTGPLWYRGLAQNPEAAEREHVRSLLETYQVNTVIVGHTPDLGIITPRFGGSVIITDTGIAAYYGSHKGSLLVENGQKFALQNGEYVPLPVDEEGIIPYFREMLELQPDNQRLAARIERLLNPPPEGTAENVSADFNNDVIEEAVEAVIE